MNKRKAENYTEAETERRFNAALRGAFETPPKPMKEIPRKRARKSRRKRTSKAHAST
jgi:hypothetical protein